MLRPKILSEWIPVAVAEVVEAVPFVSAVIPVATGRSDVPGGCTLLEFSLLATSNAAHDDLIVEIFPCPQNVAANRDNDPVYREVLDTALAHVHKTILVDWTVLGGACVVVLTRLGVTDSITVTCNYRPYAQGTY